MSSPQTTKIDPSLFRLAFDRFKAVHGKVVGYRLESFTDQTLPAFQAESYKIAIPDRAMAILEPRRWTKPMIGSGDILARVVRAIELPDNNLLQWEGRNGPDSRVHLSLFEAKKSPERCEAIESLFFDLYKRDETSERVFDGLVALCGKRYELLGYLFFVAAPNRFLPIRTRSFDKVLRQLGLDLRTEGQCGWENYNAFLSAIREVQECLHDEGVSGATLLDAHSFCWVLARSGDKKSNSKGLLPIRMRAFDGAFVPIGDAPSFSPKDDAQVRDMQAEAQSRRASGMIGEEFALKAERERLTAAGRQDLAALAQPCGDRPGLGYDISSFEIDGNQRCIEVKNVSKARRFFLSEGEWQNSRHRANYWFYLVDIERRLVDLVPASQLMPGHLRPVQYVVTYTGVSKPAAPPAN